MILTHLDFDSIEKLLSLEVFDNAADVLQIELLVDGHPDLLLSTVTGA